MHKPITTGMHSKHTSGIYKIFQAQNISGIKISDKHTYYLSDA